MILFDFEYQRPQSIEQAVALLGEQADAKLLAGGTDLLPNMRVEVVRPSHLVSLSGLTPAEPQEQSDGALRIDALTRLSSLENDALIGRRAPLLAAAAHCVGGNQVRQMGTLGGNLCQETRCLYYNQQHDYQFVADCYKRGGECCYPFPGNDDTTCWAVFCSDLAPALIALDAEVEILGPEGRRRQAIEDLYSGDGMRPLTLGEAEIVTAVTVPKAPSLSGWAFHKTSLRGGLEFGMVVMALTLQLEDDRQTCAGAR
ncbi:MAG: FAD binding domain-containing protein, partial [Candidatus Latescibacteria bacterium]|nr:FAD binding domain-containing protein [Candidatus Latescibacterota bacterium]